MTETVRTSRIPTRASDRFRRELWAAMEKQPLESDLSVVRFAEQHCELLNRHVPDLSSQLERLGLAGEPESLVLKGLPASRDEGDFVISKVVSAMLSISIRHDCGPAQYLQEKGGDLWSVLKPVANLTNVQSGQGMIRFDKHTDFSWLGAGLAHPGQVKPQFNVLAGIRNRGGTRTAYSSVGRVVKKVLSDEELKAVSSADFVIPIPAEMGIESADSGPMPLLYKDVLGRWALQIRSSARPLDPRNRLAIRALRKLRHGLKLGAQSFCVGHGDYAVVNNILGAHARESISSNNDRLLLRLYCANQRHLSGSIRVIDARHFVPLANQSYRAANAA